MNLLLTGAWGSAKEYIPKLEALGHSVQFLQQEKESLPCDYEWIEGIVCNGLFLHHPICRFSNLQYIQLTSAGYDRVPMEYVRKHNVVIHNARGVYSIPMAEFAVTGVLLLYKQMRFFAENQKRHIWEKHRGLMELFGKAVCIVGCGDVGSACAQRFRAFGCKITGINRTIRTDQHYDIIYGLDALDSVLPDSDIIILTVPATRQTERLLNADRIKRLKSSAVIVNIARGTVIDLDALAHHIGNIGGAVLDVFEEEPLNSTSVLWEKENVIITPHNSFVGEQNQRRLAEVIVGNLLEYKK